MMRIINRYISTSILFLCLTAGQIYGQRTNIVQTVAQVTDLDAVTASSTVAFDVKAGVYTHAYTFIPSAGISAITVTVNAKAGGNNYSQVGTSSTLGDTVTFTGTYDSVQVVFVITGTGTVRSTYTGAFATGSSGSVTISGSVTVTDGSGALNTIIDSGTITAVTTITNPVTVTDGAGALNTIVDSGTLTAVTTITNPVTVTDGSGALNVIIDSGTTAVTNTGTFATQSAITAASASIASGAFASGSIASGALASGAISNGADVAEGTTTVDRCTTTDTTACTLVGLSKQANYLMGTPTGQQTMANSNSVTIASNQGAISVALSTTSGTSGYTNITGVCTGSTCTGQQGDALGHQIITTTPTVDGSVAVSSITTSTLAATAFAVKASAGNIYGVHYYNGAATVCYIQVFNLAAASVNLGTTTPLFWVAMPPVGANDAKASPISLGYASNAISAASTTTSTGSTPCTTVTVAEFFYK